MKPLQSSSLYSWFVYFSVFWYPVRAVPVSALDQIQLLNKEVLLYAETFMWSTLLLNPVQIANQIISLQLAVDLGLGREVSISTKEMVLFKTKLIESKAP